MDKEELEREVSLLRGMLAEVLNDDSGSSGAPEQTVWIFSEYPWVLNDEEWGAWRRCVNE